MKLFHLSPFEFAITNIALRRLKISRIGDLNDPFELLPIDLRDKKVRAAVRSTRQEIDKTTGVICFSSTWENPVLWSHYADKHRGIALGFEVPDNFVIPVKYADKLIDADIDDVVTATDVDLTSDFACTLLATKFADWRYENESRVFLRLDPATSEGGLFFTKFGPKLKLVEVVLGASCPTPIKRVRDLVKNYPHKVYVKRARIAFTKFRVVENRASREKV
jgi:Protein of unknown function (DUF2971)